MTQPYAAERAALVAAYRRVCDLRLNELASGNLSVRAGEGLLISPTGAMLETISEDRIVHVMPDGSFDGPHRPSTEWQMHAAIYRDHPDAQAVVHTHSDYCVALACHNLPLPGFHYLVGVFGGDDVPCIPYYTFGTAELGEAASAALRTRRACLLGNHGMICKGRTLREAMELAQRLEILCRQYVLSRALGEPDRLSDNDWKDLHAQVKRLNYH